MGGGSLSEADSPRMRDVNIAEVLVFSCSHIHGGTFCFFPSQTIFADHLSGGLQCIKRRVYHLVERRQVLVLSPSPAPLSRSTTIIRRSFFSFSIGDEVDRFAEDGAHRSAILSTPRTLLIIDVGASVDDDEES